MVKHNNVIPNQHFRKHWHERVKCHFSQPVQKKIRRQKRMEKAAAIAPRPASGPLRPYVHCPTQKYNTKMKLGRGFTFAELKAAGISPKFAATVGIAVDHRRENKCEESLKLNADRLKEYKERLVVFPRKAGKPKKGDATKEEVAAAKQLKGTIVAAPKVAPALSYTTLTEEMKNNKVHFALRDARNNAKLMGPRLMKLKAGKEEEK
jgi:large subunit ribosomal protein L13e